MRTEKIQTTSNISFQQVKPISKKAYKIGGDALKEAEIMLHSRSAAYTDLEIIPKKGILTKIKSLIFFVTKESEKEGQWVSLSVDPKGYLPKNSKRYITVDSFTEDNILRAHKLAKDMAMNSKDKPLARNTASLLPADSALLVRKPKK